MEKKDREYYRKFAWSREQRDIFAEVMDGDRHVAISATAGSGKSSTLKGLVHWLPVSTKIRIFAFNKSVADKLERELPGRVKVGTAHSYGYSLVMGATGSYDGGLTVDNEKYWKLAQSAIAKLIQESQKDVNNATSKNFPNLQNPKVLKTLLQGIIDVAHLIRVALPEFKFQPIKDEMRTYGVVVPARLRFWAIKLAMDCIILGNQMASERAVIDFDDMLWLCHLWRLRPRGKVDILMIDECFTGDTLITLSDGSQAPIKQIVEQKLPATVLSYNEVTGSIEPKRVTGWYKVPRRGREILKLNQMKATANHPVFTKEKGYVRLDELLKSNYHFLQLNNDETLRHLGKTNTDGKVDCNWIASWRCVDQSGYVERQSRQCQSKICSWRSTTGILNLEVTQTPALGRQWDWERVPDRIWWNYPQVYHFNSPSFYRDFPPVLSCWDKEKADNQGSLAQAGYASACSLVYGRRQLDSSWISSYCYLRISCRGCSVSIGTHHKGAGLCLQADDDRKRCGFDVFRNGEERFFPGSRRFYSTLHELQDWRWITTSVLPELRSPLYNFQFQPTGLHKEMFSNHWSQGCDDYVYCLDVEDNHNFFADNVLVHNCQDTTAVSQSLYRKFIEDGAKLVACGDPKQCQPPGTMVRMRDGTQKPIEKLLVGDKVCTYDRKGEHYLFNGVVSEIAARQYSGTIINVTAGGNTSMCTPNHKWMVRWNKDLTEEVFVTYLMRKGDFFRIGQTKLFLKNSDSRVAGEVGCFGLSHRARRENADAAWILGVHFSQREANMHEITYSALFGIPQTIFNALSYTSASLLNQDDLNAIFEALQPQESRAIACLEAFGRDINYPIWKRKQGEDGQQLRQGRTTIFETEACNLLSDYMKVVVVPDVIKRVKTDKLTSAGKAVFSHLPINWQPVKIKRDHYEGLVYSLNIEKHHKYVADGLVTCNSIFGFAGSLPHAFQAIVSEFNTKNMKLSVSYRCPTAHIELAKQLVDYIRPKPGAIRGLMETVDEEFFFSNVQPLDLVLCRMTAPLVRKCIDLVLCGMKAQILGNDIAEAFCRTAKNVLGYHPMPRFESELHDWLQAQLAEAEGDSMEMDNAIDTAHALQACYEAFGNQCQDINQFCDRIRVLFTVEESEDAIILTTIHRIKGGEANTVWILNSDELPPERDDIIQEEAEENVLYVAITRSKEKLYFVPSGTVYNNVGGIAILEDIDWDSLPESNATLPTETTAKQLTIYE